MQVFQVSVWFTGTYAMCKLIVSLTKIENVRIVEAINLYPLALSGIIIFLVRLSTYYLAPGLTLHRMLGERLLTIIAWVLSYYLFAKSLDKQIKNPKIAYTAGSLAGVVTFFLLPPPL